MLRHVLRSCVPRKRLVETRATRHARTVSSSTRNTRKTLIPVIAILTAGAFGYYWRIGGTDHVPQFTEVQWAKAEHDPGLTEDEVSKTLSRGAYSYHPTKRSGVDRYDETRVAANTPCEDRFTHGQFLSPTKDKRPWSAWGVFDGHSGWQTAELLTTQLVTSVRTSLKQADSLDEQTAVKMAITEGFVNLDNSIMNTALETAQGHLPLATKLRALAPAYAGSCALLALFDPSQRIVYVACTGDSRAVLGQRSADGKWEAIPLSIDQDGKNVNEIARLNGEHPGEDGIVKDGRILGIMTSRAFGDGQWKLPITTLADFRRRYRTPAPLSPQYPVLTPPYLTAEPVVTATALPSTQSFLILASDGL